VALCRIHGIKKHRSKSFIRGILRVFWDIKIMISKQSCLLTGLLLCFFTVFQMHHNHAAAVISADDIIWTSPAVLPDATPFFAEAVLNAAKAAEAEREAVAEAALPIEPAPRPAPVLPPEVDLPPWLKNAVPVKKRDGRYDIAAKAVLFEAETPPVIAIVIDDMGLSRRLSEDVAQLPAPLTLSYLPYAQDLPEQTAAARKRGHELMVHVPMQPENPHIDPGPDALTVEQNPEELLAALRHNLTQFDGYVGINNHMGSRLSRDAAAMEIVMRELQSRGLMYLDSRTTPDSLGEAKALKFDVPVSGRDVFLDHEETPEFVALSLARLERHALKYGDAIAIGHPKTVTIEALRRWIPQAEARGFQIVPVTEVVKRRMFEQDHPADVAIADAGIR